MTWLWDFEGGDKFIVFLLVNAQIKIGNGDELAPTKTIELSDAALLYCPDEFEGFQRVELEESSFLPLLYDADLRDVTVHHAHVYDLIIGDNELFQSL